MTRAACSVQALGTSRDKIKVGALWSEHQVPHIADLPYQLCTLHIPMAHNDVAGAARAHCSLSALLKLCRSRFTSGVEHRVPEHCMDAFLQAVQPPPEDHTGRESPNPTTP